MRADCHSELAHRHANDLHGVELAAYAAAREDDEIPDAGQRRACRDGEPAVAELFAEDRGDVGSIPERRRADEDG